MLNLSLEEFNNVNLTRVPSNPSLRRLGIGSWNFDLVDHTMRLDEVAFDLFGIDQKENLKVKDLNKLIGGGFSFYNSCLSALKEKRSNVQEIKLVRGAKNIAHLEFTTYAEIKNGLLISLDGNFSDISTQKSAQNKLKLQASGFEEAQEISKVGSWEWNPNTNEVKWSKQMFKILGATNFDDDLTVQEMFKYVHPEDIDELKRTSELAVHLKKAIPIEYRIITPGGEIKHIRGIGESVLDKKGNLIKLFGTIQDISESVKLKCELSSFWNNSQDLLAIISQEGDFKRINPKWALTLGYNSTELTTMNIEDIIHDEDKKVVTRKLCKLFSSNNKLTFSARALGRNGEFKYFSWSCTSDINAGLVYIAARDITEQVQSEAKLNDYARILEDKNKALEQFAYIASHDLKEPLRTISSLSKMWLKEHRHELDDYGTTIFNFIDTATTRMDNLITGLLEYSMSSENQKKQAVDCNEIAKDVVNDLKHLIDVNKATIHVGELPEIEGFSTGIQQVFQNLINNGIKFNDGATKPEIWIDAQAIDGTWTFSVKDNGIGIKDTQVARIFKIFQRLHNREDYEGCGIGLAHCSKVIEAHGGKIWVESEPGKGSTFYFTLGKNNAMERTLNIAS